MQVITVAEATEQYPRQSEGSVIELADGRLLIAWIQFRRGEGDSDFWPSRLPCMVSDDRRRTWTDVGVLAETLPGDTNVYNPNFLRRPDGAIWFIFQRYHKPWDEGYRACGSVLRRISHDEGRSWTDPEPLWERTPWSLASSVVAQLPSGRIILPVSRDLTGPRERDHSQAGAIVSDDGQTWVACETWVDLPLRGAMEPHVAPTRDGRLLMAVRTQLGAVFMSESLDEGVNWSKPQTTGLRAPESCPNVVRIPTTGDLLMIWNNSPYDPAHFSHFGKRTPLTTAISTDEGRTWGRFREIETDPNRAFTNPGCYFTSDGRAVIDYWCSEYKPSGAMRDWPIHLRLAIAPVGWFYGE